METKRDIRKRVFARRAEHTQEQIWTMSQSVAKQVIHMPAFQEAKDVYVYVDYNHEVSTRPIIEAAWELGKNVAVPKVVGKDMIFYRLDQFDQLEPGYFNIPEPARGEIVDWKEPLMIMPGVAFTPCRHRVGYGGGFYDRFLAVHKMFKIALAFEFQMMEEVPVESTDILPDVVVTEKMIYQ